MNSVHKKKIPDPRFHTEKSGIGNDREKVKKIGRSIGIADPISQL